MAGERTHLSSLSGGRDPDDAHGDTVVAEITVKMRRNGCMSTEGSITDEMLRDRVLGVGHRRGKAVSSAAQS